MDITHKQPLFYLSLTGIVTLSILSGIAFARLNSWQFANAQEGAVAADGSFACEPLVFTLSASTEDVTATATPGGSPTATARGGAATASPTATTKAAGSPTSSPKSSPSSSATARPSASATAKASTSPTATSTATKGGLPDAGISTPTLIGIAAGFLLLLAAALLAL